MLGILRSLRLSPGVPWELGIHKHPVVRSSPHQSFHSLVRSSLPVGEPSGQWALVFGTRDI